VSNDTLQAIFAAVVGLILLMAIVRLSRRGLLSFRYTLGWIGVGCIGIFSTLIIPVVEPISDYVGLSPAALLALAALLLLLIITIQLSISISGMQKHLQKLTEELGRLHQLGRALSDKQK
jgi:hypothetical protein